uniref:PiggyBac transposable element-derived protein 4 C-terminal zinc-finger domain-containing protein n=1 Tax=Cuerna arida TaxID=1464854 RepID=A0A1B6FUV6_9HEMI
MRTRSLKMKYFNPMTMHLISTVTLKKYSRPTAMTLGGDKHPLRLTARHFARPTPTPEGQTRKLQRKCYVCANTKLQPKRRKDTTFECTECNVGLCVYPCFETFHTKKTF